MSRLRSRLKEIINIVKTVFHMHKFHKLIFRTFIHIYSNVVQKITIIVMMENNTFSKLGLSQTQRSVIGQKSSYCQSFVSIRVSIREWLHLMIDSGRRFLFSLLAIRFIK